LDQQDHELLVAECRASGMTAKAWCELKGIQYKCYCRWATKANKKTENPHQKWAEVTLIEEKNSSSEIQINCGKWNIYVESGFNPTLLADVLRVVDKLC